MATGDEAVNVGRDSAFAGRSIVVSGIGLCSSFGGAVHAAGAFRCGLSGGEELPEWPYFDEQDHDDQLLRGHPAMHVEPGFQGAARLLKLGLRALEDLATTIDFASQNQARLGLLAVLPPRAAALERMRGELGERLMTGAGLALDARSLRASFEGRVGFANAVREALHALQQNQLDGVIITVIDTLLDAPVIAELMAREAIKTTETPVGLVPGEVGCALFLEKTSRAKRRGGPLGAFIHAPSAIAPPEPEGSPPNQKEPPGKALSRVIQEALHNTGAPPEPKGTLYADLNGQTPRAMDFGCALLALGAAHPVQGWRRAFAAESFGDTGAGSAALAVCLAVRSFVRGYSNGRQALVVMSCERGGKAALGLTKADDHGGV